MIDISKTSIDQGITAADSTEAHKVTSMLDAFTTTSPDVPKWTPRVVADKASIGGLGPGAIGSPGTYCGQRDGTMDPGGGS